MVALTRNLVALRRGNLEQGYGRRVAREHTGCPRHMQRHCRETAAAAALALAMALEGTEMCGRLCLRDAVHIESGERRGVAPSP